jgi:hypothetical protein
MTLLVRICGKGEALGEGRCGQKIATVSGMSRAGPRIWMAKLAVYTPSMQARFQLSVRRPDFKFLKHFLAAAVLRN